MRRVTGLVAVALVFAACSTPTSTEPTAAETTAAGGVTTTAAPTTTGASGSTVPGAVTTTSRVAPDGEAAPDFTLALGEGGEFTLSDEQKPVYMVFWAEW
ncbi:MAG: hypothetical protein WD184_08015 [Acidimicrobiia bacterium]